MLSLKISIYWFSYTRISKPTGVTVLTSPELKYNIWQIKIRSSMMST